MFLLICRPIKGKYHFIKVGRQLILVEQMGTDRTCQVSALAQVIIDPFYRTIAGFSILIEK